VLPLLVYIVSRLAWPLAVSGQRINDTREEMDTGQQALSSISKKP